MKEPLVSIIVPIYNAERSIDRCLRSIKRQSYRNIEILLVNDGSQDGTLPILQKYENMDDRFHVIEKENTGVSDSRNQGILAAKGEYLQFVDSDDWIAETATETFVKTAVTHACDMVISDYYRMNKTKISKRGDIPNEGLISRKEYAEYMMNAPANFYYGVLWNKLFRTDFVREHQLFCAPDLQWCEDFQFVLEYLQYVETIYVCKKPNYYYVKTKGSLVATQISLTQIIYTKKSLFKYYKALYQSIGIYEENKMKIQLFFVAISWDKDHNQWFFR